MERIRMLRAVEALSKMYSNKRTEKSKYHSLPREVIAGRAPERFAIPS